MVGDSQAHFSKYCPDISLSALCPGRKFRFKPKRKVNKEMHDHNGGGGGSSSRHHRRRDDPLSNVHHLLDVKAAIERLKLHNQDDDDDDDGSCSSYSSTSEVDHRAAASAAASGTNNNHGKVNKNSSSLEGLNVTSADEFVWIDSHNRLVELQQLPWTSADLSKVIKRSLESDTKFGMAEEL